MKSFKATELALAALLTLGLPAHADAPVEELILGTTVQDRAPVPVVVLKRGDSYYVPFTQAPALGLPGAQPLELPGLPEPVIAGLVALEVGEDTLTAQVPLTYFAAQLFNLNMAIDTAALEPVPAAWVNYDLFYQPLPGLRALGGTVQAAASYNGWSLDALLRMSRNKAEAAVSRTSTTLSTRTGNRVLSVGDVAVAQGIPLLSNRQALGVQVRGQLEGPTRSKELKLSGQAPSSGVVTVMANQQQLYQAVAQAGTYEVRGLPAIPGDTRYTVYFDDGQSVRLLESLETSEALTLLSAGALDYQVSIGIPRVLNNRSSRAEYESTAVLEGSAVYGLSRWHNVAARGYLSEPESWLGGGIRSEWTPRLYTSAQAYLVRAPGNQGVLVMGSGHYSFTDFRVGANFSRYSNSRGTPVDGFLSESRVFAGWRGFNGYWLRSKSTAEGQSGGYETYGLNKTYSFNHLSLSLNASQTVRAGLREPPFFSAMMTWELDRGRALSSTVTRNKVVAEATYFSEEWGASLSASSGKVGRTSSASGFYNTQYGTLFGTHGQGRADSVAGLSGGAVLFHTDGAVHFQPTANRQGDSLLVVDAGAAGAEILVESHRKYVTGASGHVAVPFNSQVPQRIELNIRSLSADVSAEEVRHLVQTMPFEAMKLKFDTSPMGFGVNLVLPSGEPVPEGSMVYLPGETTLVSGDGLVWLPRALPSFRVQTAKGQFCTVSGAKEEAVLPCTP